MINYDSVSEFLERVFVFATRSSLSNEMTQVEQEDGVAPLQTLPAQHYNFLFKRETVRLNNLFDCVKSLLKEFKNLLGLASTTPSGASETQIQTFFGTDYPGSILPSKTEQATAITAQEAGTTYAFTAERTANRASSLAKVEPPIPMFLGGTGATSAAGAYANIKTNIDGDFKAAVNSQTKKLYFGTEITPSTPVGDIDGIEVGAYEYSLSDNTARSGISDINSKIPSAASPQNPLALQSGVTANAQAIAGINEKIPANASSSNKLVSQADVPSLPDITQLKSDVAAIEGKIPSNASTSNQMVTASDITGIAANAQAISEINSRIPASASSSNKLATASDVTAVSNKVDDIVQFYNCTFIDPVEYSQQGARVASLSIPLPGLYLVQAGNWNVFAINGVSAGNLVSIESLQVANQGNNSFSMSMVVYLPSPTTLYLCAEGVTAETQNVTYGYNFRFSAVRLKSY